MRLELVALLLTAAAQDNEAEKLFRKMEKQITQAKTLQFEFETNYADKAKGEDGQFKGKAFLAPGNKMQLEATIALKGMQINLEIISDGKNTKVYVPGLGKAVQEADTPPALYKDAKDGVAHFSIITAFAALDKKQKAPFNLADLTLSDFKLGKTEVINGVKAQVVTYKATPKDKADKKDTAVITVWLDAKTSLPLKRVISPVDQGQALLTETYSGIMLNPKLDPKLFEQPQ